MWLKWYDPLNPFAILVSMPNDNLIKGKGKHFLTSGSPILKLWRSDSFSKIYLPQDLSVQCF